MGKGTMKFYYILLGLGIGMVLGGTFFILNPKIEYRYKEYTDEEILEKAAEIKLDDAKNKDISENNSDINTNENTNEGTDNENKDKLDNLGNENQTNDNENNEDELDQDNDKNNANNEDEVTDNSNDDSKQEDSEQQDGDSTISTEDEDNLISIKIYWGDSSEEIVHKLYDKGIISDKKGFNDYILENRAEKKLKPGTYEFKKGTGFEEILDELLQ